MEIFNYFSLELNLFFVILVLSITIFAGIIKGIVGFAMPLIMVTGFATFLPLDLAIVAMIIPTLVTNFQQAFRDGINPAIIPLKKYWKYLLILCLTVLISSQLMPIIPDQTLFLTMGFPIFGFTLLQILKIRLKIFNGNQTITELVFGFFAGFFGGLAGTWGPPTVSFFLTQNLDRKLQLRSQGIIYFFCSITFIIGHTNTQLFTLTSLTFSTILLVPAILGVTIGNRLSRRMDSKRYIILTQILLLLASINLIRRGLGY